MSVQVIMQKDMSGNRKGSLLKIYDFGLQEYQSVLNLQKKYFQTLIEAKTTGESSFNEILLIGEHYPVITYGRHANQNNILQEESFLTHRNIKIHHIERGGDVTFHGPGQLIAYPICDLSLHSMGVKNFVTLLEESIIRLLAIYDLVGERIEGATGVWLGKGSENERKICAIGIKCSRFCTMHGLALNVNTDLTGFSYINPCGFINKGVTSIANELGYSVDMNKIKREFSDIFLCLILSL